MTTGVTPIKYEWRPGFVGKLDPEIAGRELDRLAKRDQEVVPITLVEENRTPGTPLYEYFDQDDTTAASSWRVQQARQVIGALKIVYVRNDTEEPLPPVRAYVSVVNDPELDMYAPNTPKVRHYRPIAKVMSNADLRDQYRRQAFDTLCSWRERYADIEEFARIFQEIDTLKERYQQAA